MARKIANIYRREDGTYQLRFTVDGKRYAVYGKTVDECRQRETQKRQEIEAGAYQRQKDVTLGKYAAWWLSGKKGTVQELKVQRSKPTYELMRAARGCTEEEIKLATNMLKRFKLSRKASD